MLLQTPPSLLITDDDAVLRETLRGVFEPEGYRTLLASDGDEALEIVQSQAVHVVLMDMHMPRLTGLETLQRVRQLRAMLPCILMSANLDDSIREAAEQASVFAVLMKPITRRQIVRQVHLALERTYNWRRPQQ